MVNHIVGDPEHLVPGGDACRPPTYTKADTKKATEAAFVSQSELLPIQVRTFAIRKGDVLTHGPSDRCAGCRCVMMGVTVNRPHSTPCNERFEKLIAAAEGASGRVQRATERMRSLKRRDD